MRISYVPTGTLALIVAVVPPASMVALVKVDGQPLEKAEFAARSTYLIEESIFKERVI